MTSSLDSITIKTLPVSGFETTGGTSAPATLAMMFDAVIDEYAIAKETGPVFRRMPANSGDRWQNGGENPMIQVVKDH